MDIPQTMRKTRSEASKTVRCNVKVIQVKPAVDQWINENIGPTLLQEDVMDRSKLKPSQNTTSQKQPKVIKASKSEGVKFKLPGVESVYERSKVPERESTHKQSKVPERESTRKQSKVLELESSRKQSKVPELESTRKQSKVLELESTRKQSKVLEFESTRKQSKVLELESPRKQLSVKVTESDSDEEENSQPNDLHRRKSILKIPSDLSSPRSNVQAETPSKVTKPRSNVQHQIPPPRSIQVRAVEQGSSSSVVGFDLNAGKVLREESSRALVIHHSKSAGKKFPTGECPALEKFYGSQPASCSNISSDTHGQSGAADNKHKGWRVPHSLEPILKERGKKKKWEKDKKAKVKYTSIEKFVDPTDEELKGKPKSNIIFKIFGKKKLSKLKGTTTWHTDLQSDKVKVDHKVKFKKRLDIENMN